jgi:hypothetical protein
MVAKPLVMVVCGLVKRLVMYLGARVTHLKHLKRSHQQCIMSIEIGKYIAYRRVSR